MDSERYIKPAELPPNPALLELYLRDAQPTGNDVRLNGTDVVEARRIQAVMALLAVARSELVKSGDRGGLLSMPRALRRFLEMAGLQILTAEHPAAELRRFLGRRRRVAGGRLQSPTTKIS